ncbi:MAG TPA: GNAT family protein [Asanoa sp.]|nr:GNAT family protein [Asanoa sp.]
MVVTEIPIQLRPVGEDDLDMLRRFVVEPGLIGLDWNGFQDAQGVAKRYADDGFLGETDGRLIVEAAGRTAGFVSYTEGVYAGRGRFWEIGIALLPDSRGRGIGWRAQAMLCDYLFAHSPAQRIQAGTHAENLAEQRSLVKAGFQLEGVMRACEFRDGAWRAGHLYSRLRTDPSPL